MMSEKERNMNNNYRSNNNSGGRSSRAAAQTPKPDRRMMVAALLCVLVLVIAVGYIAAQSCADKPDDPTGGGTVHTPVDEGPATVRVTFPEGYNVMQMAARLEENGVCSADAFCETMNTVDFSADFDFLPPFSELQGRTYLLEGYLFPDTYDFFVGEAPESVIKRFLRNFGGRIGDELREAALTAGDFYGIKTSLDDVLIMASIVEREISVPGEMPGVAAVFYNRIKYPGGTVDGSATGGFFQSDATKFYPYIMDTMPEGFVSEYNTFNVKGLPKGPICCPSYDAIYAAIHPDHDNTAFFFYTDINKKVYYAVTLSEHQKNWKYCVDNGLNPW